MSDLNYEGVRRRVFALSRPVPGDNFFYGENIGSLKTIKETEILR